VGEREGGREILQDIDALALSQALEDSGLDLGEIDHGFACGILQPDYIQSLDIPGGDVLGKGQRRRAAGLELKLQALCSRIRLQRDDAGLAALGGGKL